MKKKIFLGLLLGALSFSSCVKDNESDAVKKQRDAQSELILAQAKLKEKEADLKAADAKVQEAIAKLKDAQVQGYAASSTIAWAKAEVEVKQQELKKEQAEALFAAALEAEKAKIEGLKVDRVNNLVTAVTSATTLYSNAVSSVVAKENDINNTKKEIAKLEAGVETATTAKNNLIAKEESIIKKAEIKKAALNEAIASNFTSLDKLREDFYKKENEKNKAQALFAAESEKTKAFYEKESSDYKKAKANVEDEKMLDFEFFKSLKEVYDITKVAVPAEASHIVTNLSGSTFTLLEIETDASEVVGGTTYNMYKAVDTNADLKNRFFSPSTADFVLDEIKLKVNKAEKAKKDAVTVVDEKEKEYKAAQESLTTNTSSQTLIDNFNNAKQALLTAKKDKDTKEKEWNELKERQKKFEDAVAAVDKKENQDAVLLALKKFFEQQTELKNKLKNVKELEADYNSLNDQFEAFKSSIAQVNSALSVAGATSSETVVQKLEAAIADEDTTIAEANANIKKYSEATSANELLQIEQAKLGRYEEELKVLRRQLDAARKVYDNAIKALEEAMKS